MRAAQSTSSWPLSPLNTSSSQPAVQRSASQAARPNSSSSQVAAFSASPLASVQLVETALAEPRPKPHHKESTLKSGCSVEVLADFESADEPSVTLRQGMKGRVEEIDDYGDANINFDLNFDSINFNTNITALVYREDLSKLRVLPEGECLKKASDTKVGAELLVIRDVGAAIQGTVVIVKEIDTSDNTVLCHVPSLGMCEWVDARMLAKQPLKVCSGLALDDACSKGNATALPSTALPSTTPALDGLALDDALPSTTLSEGVLSPCACTSEDTQEPSQHWLREDSVASEDPEVSVPRAATLLEFYSGFANEDAHVDDRFKRLAFRRFQVGGVNEITQERLHHALVHISFLTSTREHALDLSTEVSRFHHLDYNEFCRIVDRLAAVESADVRQRAEACLAERRGAALDRVQTFLFSAGVCLPYSDVEKARTAGNLNYVRPEEMSTDDLLLTLAACKVNEGFTREEVATAHEIFGRLEKERPLGWGSLRKAWRSGGLLEEKHAQPFAEAFWGPLAKASALSAGLLEFAGPYGVGYWDTLADILPSGTAEQQGVCLYEFLIWARRLRDAMIQDLWKCFKDFETSGSGVIQLDIAISIAERFGVSLLTDAVHDLLSDLGMQKDATLDFHALVRFIGEARRMHGFSRSEQDELSAAFEKMDHDGTGELSRLQVIDLLRHLGSTTSVDHTTCLFNRVDLNKKGYMGRDEFLRLMRLLREEDLVCARESFDELSNSTGRLPTGSVQDAFAMLNFFPGRAVLEELLQDVPAEVCFTSFMRLRFRANLALQRHAGFQEDALEEIAEFWNHGCSSRGSATLGEVIQMFADSRVAPVNTRRGREELLRRVQAARAAAIAAGAPEEPSRGSTTDSDLGFCTFVHLIRGLVRDSEGEAIAREREESGFFQKGRADELYRAFCDLAAREANESSPLGQPAARRGPCLDRLLALLTRVPLLPDSTVPLLLRSVGAEVPRGRVLDIMRFLAEARSLGEEADENAIQFATFLRLLRWLTDTDFEDIGGVTDCP